MQVRVANQTDATAVRELLLAAFGLVEGRIIAGLVSDLLRDASAEPRVSLKAAADSNVIGYVLFTHAEVRQAGGTVPATILAPLAVAPGFQSRGVGGRLIGAGLEAARDLGAELAFVLGHPGYYPRHGFVPAGPLGLEAPYPLTPAQADAWMVQPLDRARTKPAAGKVSCARSLQDPAYWRE